MSLQQILNNIEQLRQDVINIGDDGAPEASDKKSRLDFLLRSYAEIARYDCHYSAVRTGLGTFLTGIGLVYGIYAVVRESEPFGILMVFVLYSFAFFFNLYFMRMTRACWEMQKEIEGIFTGDDFKQITNGAPMFRERLRVMIKGGSKYSKEVGGIKSIRWTPDLHAGVTGGGYALVVVLLTAYCWNFNDKCGCRIGSLHDADVYASCSDTHQPQHFRFDDGQMKELLEKLGGNLEPAAGLS